MQLEAVERPPISLQENDSCSLPMVSGAEGNGAGLSDVSWGDSIMLWMLFTLLGEETTFLPKTMCLTTLQKA